MINESLYNKTVDILVQAYFNDTLLSQTCCACAVGNIVAANMGYRIVKISDKASWFKDGENIRPSWGDVCSTTRRPQLFYSTLDQKIDPAMYKEDAAKQIDSTGYDPDQISKIEYSFECGFSALFKKDRMFNGLMAVVAVLDEIHQNTDTTVTASTKQRFVKI